MPQDRLHARTIVFSLAVFLLCALPSTVAAHCDTMNGPVVLAAKHALETGNVNFVLIWVQKDDEAIIRDAFQRTMKVRNLDPQAKELAEMYFFETVVRVHRAGEGVAYTGLKPAETEIDPGIAAADQAIERGTHANLLKHLQESLHRGIDEMFERVMTTQNYDPNNLAEGRAYVQAYVAFIHYSETLFQAAAKTGPGHLHELNAQPLHHDQH